jgi:hypothetical protein
MAYDPEETKKNAGKGNPKAKESLKTTTNN